MIPVVWHAQADGRGRFNCTTMLNDMFDHYEGVQHFGGAKAWPEEVIDGAVVVVHGGREVGHLDRLNIDLDNLEWALVIFLGDEEASFPVLDVHFPKRSKIWIQEPLVPGPHSLAHRFILDGYSHDFRRWVVKNSPKDLDWIFAGQVTHQRRRECVTALQSIDWGGMIIETKGYCQGVSKREYTELLSRSWIVACPSGPHAQDAARPWEALDCGAIPILDDLSPRRRVPGFWNYVLGPGHPLPVITDWTTLPSVIDDLKHHNLKLLAEDCAAWWVNYQCGWLQWLKKDLEELGVRR
jgi:hypothetical protein